MRAVPHRFRRLASAAALLVSLHLAWLPLLAATHEASHARANARTGLEEPLTICPGGEKAGHRVHLDRQRASPHDLGCDLCVSLQHAAGKKAAPKHGISLATAKPVLAAPAQPDHPFAFLGIDRPSGRSPPA